MRVSALQRRVSYLYVNAQTRSRLLIGDSRWLRATVCVRGFIAFCVGPGLWRTCGTGASDGMQCVSLSLATHRSIALAGIFPFGCAYGD
jgi:hypothetical protein